MWARSKAANWKAGKRSFDDEKNGICLAPDRQHAIGAIEASSTVSAQIDTEQCYETGSRFHEATVKVHACTSGIDTEQRDEAGSRWGGTAKVKVHACASSYQLRYSLVECAHSGRSELHRSANNTIPFD